MSGSKDNDQMGKIYSHLSYEDRVKIDIAFKQWSEFEKLLQAPIYFCHPYHSWEKGLVENANKWIRHFIPKKTDLQCVTKEKVAECLSYLNDRPREVLQFKTANEVYWEKLM